MDSFVLSEKDRRWVISLIDNYVARRINTVGRVGELRVDIQEMMTPEVYVAKTPKDGIPALILACGTGTGTCDVDLYDVNDKPGYADCDIQRIMREEEEEITDNSSSLITTPLESKRVYNITLDDIPEFTYILAVKDSYGNFIAVPDSRDLILGCHMEYSPSGELRINLDELLGKGLEVDTGTGSCDRISIKIGCNLKWSDETQAAAVQVDVDSLAGDGLYEETGTGTCSHLSVKVGCNLEIGEENEVRVNVFSLAGDGLEVGTGTGSCDNLNVSLGCHLELDSNNRIRVNVGSLAGMGLYEDAGTGSCSVLSILLGCHLDFDEDDAVYVDLSTIAGDGLVVVPDPYCDLLAVYPGCHIEIDPIGRVAVNLDTLIRGDGLTTEPGTGSCDHIAVKIGCHLDINEDGEVYVTPETLIDDRDHSALVVVTGDCDVLSVDLNVDPTRTTTETLDRFTGAARVGDDIRMYYLRTVFTNTFNLAGLPIGRTAAAPTVGYHSANICEECCTGTATETTLMAAPTGTPAAPGNVIIDQTIQLMSNASGGSTPYFYQWFFEDAVSEDPVDVDFYDGTDEFSENPNISFSTQGDKLITLQVTDNCGSMVEYELSYNVGYWYCLTATILPDLWYCEFLNPTEYDEAVISGAIVHSGPHDTEEICYGYCVGTGTSTGTETRHWYCITTVFLGYPTCEYLTAVEISDAVDAGGIPHSGPHLTEANCMAFCDTGTGSSPGTGSSTGTGTSTGTTSGNSVVYDTAGSHDFTPPSDGNYLVEGWGADGGGASANGDFGSGGGGGGGGEYRASIRALTVSGGPYPLNIGAAGVGGTPSSNGTDGGDTTFNTSDVVAKGGGGGQSGSGSGGSGGAGGTGDINHFGGNGGVGSSGGIGGGGGGRAGSTGDGGTGDDGNVGGAGGTAGPGDGGGAGGDGGVLAPGSDGSATGGAGGGGGTGSSGGDCLTAGRMRITGPL